MNVLIVFFSAKTFDRQIPRDAFNEVLEQSETPKKNYWKFNFILCPNVVLLSFFSTNVMILTMFDSKVNMSARSCFSCGTPVILKYIIEDKSFFMNL